MPRVSDLRRWAVGSKACGISVGPTVLKFIKKLPARLQLCVPPRPPPSQSHCRLTLPQLRCGPSWGRAQRWPTWPGWTPPRSWPPGEDGGSGACHEALAAAWDKNATCTLHRHIHPAGCCTKSPLHAPLHATRLPPSTLFAAALSCAPSTSHSISTVAPSPSQAIDLARPWEVEQGFGAEG